MIIIVISSFIGCSSSNQNTSTTNIAKNDVSDDNGNISRSLTPVTFNDVTIAFSYNYTGDGWLTYVINVNVNNANKATLSTMINVSCNYKYKVGSSNSVYYGSSLISPVVYLYNESNSSTEGSLMLNISASDVSCSYYKVYVMGNYGS